MTTCYYCTPEWLKESAGLYQSNLSAQEKLKKLSGKVVFRVQAEPSWGIEKDIFFCLFFETGELIRLELISEEEGKKEAEFIMGATPVEWKKILRKESKFITDFMLGKIKLEKGSKIGVLAVAPHANNMVELLTAVDLIFPDDLSEEDLEQYKTRMKSFRKELEV
jgi:hypothetical protein